MAKKKKLPVANDVQVARMSPDEDMKYKAKYALEDIERAEAHKRDKELMKHVKKYAKEKMNALKDVCGE